MPFSVAIPVYNNYDFWPLIPINNHVIISCRVKDYGEIGQKAVLKGAITLHALDDTQMQSYLSNQPDLWATLQADNKLREVARTPLLLSLFAYAFNGLDEEAKKLHDLSRGDLRDKVFETYVRRRYDYEARKHPLRYTFEEMAAALQHAAFANAGDIKRRKNILLASDFVTDGQIDAPALIDQAQQLHLLVPTESGEYRFIHLLLRDYFAFPMALEALDDQQRGANDPFTLITPTQRKQADLHRRALWALAEIGDARAVNSVSRMLGSENPATHVFAMNALERIGTPEALAAMTAWRQRKRWWQFWRRS